MNSRGRHEQAIAAWIVSAAGSLEKALWDLLIWNTDEFNFVRLPNNFTTGSSLMPQKQNPDVLELARGRCRELRGLAALLSHLSGGLPSSYHRDQQFSKAPFLKIVVKGEQLFDVVTRLLPRLEINEQACASACSEEIHAANDECAWRRKECRSALLTRRSRGNCRTELSATPVNASSAVPETGQLALRKLAVALADSKNWIGDRRRFLSPLPNVSSIGHEHSPSHSARLFRRTGYFVLCSLAARTGTRGPYGHVDTGGFGDAELERIEKLARQLGAESHTTINARDELFRDYLRFLIAGNALRGGMYPLSVSAERVCQARGVVRHARQINAFAIAHGSTGAGNDQVRFDVAFRALAPEFEILTPIRDLALSRAEERAFLSARGFTFPEKVEQYSLNQGMWVRVLAERRHMTPGSIRPTRLILEGKLIRRFQRAL